MRKTVSFLFFWISIVAFSQMENPVKWTTHTEKVNDSVYNLVMKATIDKGWHMYSQHSPEGGSLPIEITSEKADKDFKLNGKAEESATHKEFNKTFGVEEIFFTDTATLKQQITLLNKDVKEVTLDFYGQACIDACIQLEEHFTFDLTKATTAIEPLQATTPTPKTIEDTTTSPEKTQSWWTIFFLSFLGGLAALLTPCVFPMIPMTVSYFLKQSKTKAKGVSNAVFYGISIVVIYVLIGTLVTAFFGADAMNEFSTGALFNLVFFAILLVFAFSFLGAFEIILPSSWGTKVDAGIDKNSGYLGIFLMALALAIVSFSCTLPIVGTALAASASSGGLAPIISMLGFSIALALPFTLFAMFPGWLNAMPKSGGWLNTVKVVLGFLELALAFKFLSNADLVYDMHWLERETFLAIWIAVFGALAFYLFGKIRLPHDDAIEKISVGRLVLALLTLTFTIYLIPGLWGAPLKLISGFPPPLHYAESPYGVGFSKQPPISFNGEQQKLPEHAHLGPHDIISFDNYDHALAYAKEVGKPLMLDFTGKACVNCRKMEDYVWSDPAVMEVLKNEVVLASLYVDFKEELPKEQQYISEHTGKKIRTVGNKWSEMQTVKYKTNTQPYYVILNPETEEMQHTPYTYNSDVEKFHNWLKEGVSKK